MAEVPVQAQHQEGGCWLPGYLAPKEEPGLGAGWHSLQVGALAWGGPESPASRASQQHWEEASHIGAQHQARLAVRPRDRLPAQTPQEGLERLKRRQGVG